MPDLRPSPPDSILKLAARTRARGAAEVLSLMWERIREEIRSHDTLVFLVRELDATKAPPVPDDLEVRPAGAADAKLYARDIGTDSAGTFRRRLSESTRCWIMLEEGRILHASWTTSAAAWTRELRRYFRPPAGDLYVYESFTRADARGRGAYPLVLGHLCADAAARGLARAWVGVEKDNAASLKAVGKGGFEPACEVAFGRRWASVYLADPRGERAGECRECLVRAPLPESEKRGWRFRT